MDKCPFHDECIGDIRDDIRELKANLQCAKKNQQDFVSMSFMKILITVSVIVLGGIFSMLMLIKSDVSAISTHTAVNSQRMLSIEKQIETHTKTDDRKYR